MSRWIQTKHPEFVRDLFKFFCQSCEILEARFAAFDAEEALDFAMLKDIVGTEMDKGLLWRMKDTAHHVFRNDPHSQSGGKFLEWAIGYIFHETIKLKEDAYQKQNYAPWLHKLNEEHRQESEKDITEQLFQILNQTEESIRREIDRIRFIMDKCRQLLPDYLRRYSDNVLLARYIFSQNETVREAFKEKYDNLIFAIYGSEPERMLLLASQSLRKGGWLDEATEALNMAEEQSPGNKLVLQEKEIVANWIKRMKN